MQEIERKFLIDPLKWKPKGKESKLIQGYLSTDPERVVRVRIAGDQAFLTIKGKINGISRTELEYKIPVNEAEILFNLCLNSLVSKTRYTEDFAGLVWEIDVFEGENKGLFLAEVELAAEDQQVELPDWIVKEVSDDRRYYNSSLSKFPFSGW